MRLLSLDDFLALQVQSSWLIDGWLPAGSMCMLHGPPGSGKTFLALDWALRMATGTPTWCDRAVDAGQVLYLAGEGHRGLGRRIEAWMLHNQCETKPDIMLSSGSCYLDDADDLLHLLDEMDSSRINPKLIVVDTLHRHLSGDENDSRDAGRMIDACSTILSRVGNSDASILLIHHVGVSASTADRARGSSAWRGALDSEINIAAGSNGTLLVRQVKMKDSAPAKSECFEMTSIETKTGPGCALSRITQDVFIPKDEKKEKANTPEVLGEKAGLPASILRKKK